MANKLNQYTGLPDFYETVVGVYVPYTGATADVDLNGKTFYNATEITATEKLTAYDSSTTFSVGVVRYGINGSGTEAGLYEYGGDQIIAAHDYDSGYFLYGAASLQMNTANASFYLPTSVVNNNAGIQAFRVYGAFGQSADSLQLLNSSATVLSRFNSVGSLALGVTTAPGNLAIPNTNFYTATRTVPTTVGDAVLIGNFALTNGTASIEIWLGIQGVGYSQGKRYFIQCAYNGTAGAWQTVRAASTTGSYLRTQNANLEIRQSNNTAEFRLRRELGTTAATAYITIIHQGVQADAFTALSTVSAVAAPTVSYNNFADGLQSYYLQNNPSGTLANFQPGSYPISTTPGLLMSTTTNGGGTPSATESALVLARNGVNGAAFGNVVEFKIGRYENVSTNARTALDVALTHGNGDASGTNIIRLQSNGSVGIGTGTTVLTNRVDVNGNATFGTFGTAARQILIGQVSTFPGLWLGANTTSPSTSNYSLLYDGTNNAINSPTGGTVQCRINNAVLLTINSSRLLMGATTSSATATPLNFSFGGTYGTSTPGVTANLKWYLYDDGTSANAYGIGMSAGLMEFRAGASAGIAFFPNDGVEAVRIASTGNVGVGTTTLTAKFNVVNSAAATIATIIKGATSQSANLTEWRDSAAAILTRVAANGTFFPLQAPTASAPTYVVGAMYFDTTLNKLRIGGAAGWETVTSA